MARGGNTGNLAGMIIALVLFFPIALVVLLIKGIAWLIAYFVSLKKQNEELKIYNDMLNIDVQEQLQKIDTLEGIQFEKYIGQLLKKIGFVNVVVTKGSGDFGADIIAEKEGEKYAFQCKRFSSPIGPRPIGEVLRGMNKYQCTKGIVVTNNYFTSQAIQEAKVSNIELWDRNKIISLLNKNTDKIIDKEKFVITQNEEDFEDESKVADNKIEEGDKRVEEKNNENNIHNILKYTDLIAGYYEIDEDLEEGKYIIEAISGDGQIIVSDVEKNIKVSELIGTGDSSIYIHKFNNLKLKVGDVVEISSTVVLRFTKIK